MTFNLLVVEVNLWIILCISLCMWSSYSL